MTQSALVLAAGSSTRLRPLTDSLPKCLLPIGGKPILAHQLDALIEAQIREVTVVVGFEKEKIIEYVAAQRYPIEIKYLHNDAYKTTGPILGGLLPAMDILQGPLLFFHCDVLFDAAAVRALLAQEQTSMLYRVGGWDEEAGKIVIGENNRVTELGKHVPKDSATGEYLQIAKFEAPFCNALRETVRARAAEGRDGYTIDAFNDVIQMGVDAFGVPFSGRALEIDTPEDYRAAQDTYTEAKHR